MFTGATRPCCANTRAASSVIRARGVWDRAKAKGTFAAFTAPTVAPTARRSSGDGLTGIRTRSTMLKDSDSHPDAAGGVSMMQRSNCALAASSVASSAPGAGSRSSIAGVSASRLSHQPRREAWGSRSRQSTLRSSCDAATDRLRTSVVLPEPPFCEETSMVCIVALSHIYVFAQLRFCAFVRRLLLIALMQHRNRRDLATSLLRFRHPRLAA